MGAAQAPVSQVDKKNTELDATARPRIRIGSFNILCPAYGLKWGEREACLEWTSKENHGGCNWNVRLPALLRLISSAECDVLALQEIQASCHLDLEIGLRSITTKLHLEWYNHPGRQDAVGIAFNPEKFDLEKSVSCPLRTVPRKVTNGSVDLVTKEGGQRIRVVTTHQGGRRNEQLEDVFKFAQSGSDAPDIIAVCGDFNEDFGEAGCKIAESRGFSTLPRTEGEPLVSRPVHKQGADQSSGKGKIDYIFVCGGNGLIRDEVSSAALLASHAPCEETGEWPSDHGMEVLSVVL